MMFMLLRLFALTLTCLSALAFPEEYDITVGMGNAHTFISIVKTKSDADPLKPDILPTIETGRVIDPELWGLPSSMKAMADTIVVFENGLKKAVKAFDIPSTETNQCRVFVGIAGYEAYGRKPAVLGEVTFAPVHQYLGKHIESASTDTQENFLKDAIQSILKDYGFVVDSNTFWMTGDQHIPGRIA